MMQTLYQDTQVQSVTAISLSLKSFEILSKVIISNPRNPIIAPFFLLVFLQGNSTLAFFKQLCLIHQYLAQRTMKFLISFMFSFHIFVVRSRFICCNFIFKFITHIHRINCICCINTDSTYKFDGRFNAVYIATNN